MRFGFDDRVDHRAGVFRDLLRRERSFADRHVQFVSQNIDQNTYNWLATYAGGEVLNSSNY